MAPGSSFSAETRREAILEGPVANRMNIRGNQSQWWRDERG
jgi:hypothetical protein